MPRIFAASIVTPGIDPNAVRQYFEQTDMGVFGLLNLFVFAMGRLRIGQPPLVAGDAAALVLSRLSEVLASDEHVVPLKARLDELERDAMRLLTAAAPPPAPAA